MESGSGVSGVVGVGWDGMVAGGMGHGRGRENVGTAPCRAASTRALRRAPLPSRAVFGGSERDSNNNKPGVPRRPASPLPCHGYTMTCIDPRRVL